MATLDEVMSHDPVVVDADTRVAECAQLMRDHSIGAIGLERDGALCGVLTDRDIVVRAVADKRDPCDLSATELASGDVLTVPAGSDLGAAEDRMRDAGVRRLFVVGDDGAPVGIISADDLIARREPESVVATQLDEARLIRGDQGYTGQAE
jgi:CBS domain-containing protein